MKKYELVDSNIHGTYKIRALIDIPEHGVKAGDIGGYVDGEHNLSQKRTGWIDASSTVEGCAFVEEGLVQNSSIISDDVTIWNGTVTASELSGNTVVNGNVTILNSTIQNGELLGTGNIVDSELKNVFLRQNYVLNHAIVKSENRFMCYGKQVWSHVDIAIEDGKMEKDLEMRDTYGTFKSLNIFETSHLDYVKIVNPELSLTFGDSNLRNGESKIFGKSKESPVILLGDILLMLSSRIEGNVEVNGRLKMVGSAIEDFAQVYVMGMMENTIVSDFAVVLAEGSDYTKIVDHELAGDATYQF